MIVFLSNYYNHHQAPFSEEIFRLTQGQYCFIGTKPMEEERLKMGWGEVDGPFVMQYFEAPERCQKLIDKAEIVIFGSAPYALLKKRLRKDKLTIVYSERIYKRECPQWQLPLRSIRYFGKYGRFSNVYLLCASAYTASDYARTGTFIEKAYKWGYFPEIKRYDNIARLIQSKQRSSILWALYLRFPISLLIKAERTGRYCLPVSRSLFSLISCMPVDMQI